MEPFISLCMIVKNEEKVLRRCLDSVKEYVDEIIIVDTGSEDSTRSIAREFTKNIFEYQWTSSFSDARNFAASKAKGEWILVLDADEYVDSYNLKNAIAEIRKNENKFDIYAVNIINFAGEYGESIAQHKHVRIYKNNNTIEFFRSIHEQLRKKNNKVVNIGLSKLMIYHSGYLTKTVQDKDKTNRNKLLIDKEMQKKNNAFDFFNLGNEYKIIGENELALDSYIEAFKRKEDFLLEWVPFCLCNMVECLIDSKRFHEALNVIGDAEKIYTNTADFPYLRGHIYLAQSRYDDAKNVFMEIVSNLDLYNDVIKSPDFREYLPNKRLGLIYELEKDYEKAIRYSIEALNNNSYCLESVIRVIKILHKFHSEIEIYEFFSNNISTHNKAFIQKILIFSLNQGFIKFSTRLSNNFCSENELIRYLVELKVNIIKGNYDIDEKFVSTIILSGFNSGIIDLSDLFILYFYMDKNEKNGVIEVVLSNSNLRSILSAINDQNKEYKTIDADAFIHLIEKCISFKKFELLNKLLELRDRLKIDLHVKIARVFNNKGYKDESIEFYQLASEESMHESDYSQIIEWLISKKQFQEAYRISMETIKEYKGDFRLYKYAIFLGTQLESIELDEIFYSAFDMYPDSNWLRNEYLRN
ncbi:glycosyltransferase [Priestia megaterium]|uniref:glycosyltransferase n=1 Tax=Priestia megaterium TaxID=1404 RepID=UPI0034590A3D